MRRDDQRLNRRHFIQGSALIAGVGAAGSTLTSGAGARAAGRDISAYIAQPPAGFVPFSAPGRIVKVSAKGDFTSIMQKNQLWPLPEVASRLLEKAMMEFTGAPNLVEAMKRFIHPNDVVAIKVNGIAGQDGYTMATNYELVLPVVEACLKVGVPAPKIMVYEQTTQFLNGTRCNVRDWRLPEGVLTGVHGGRRNKMPKLAIYQGIETQYTEFFTDATAVINLAMIKDHSICGYTGAMKNITHGNISNPHEHHAHQASPQIALLYRHPIVTSRVRLHLTDAFKVIYDQGPLDRNPKTRIPHGAVYVATDPVAMDTLGTKIVEDERKARGVKSLTEAGRAPRYVRTAGELGLGIHDLNRIALRSFEV